jgi:hypothetical protein
VLAALALLVAVQTPPPIPIPPLAEWEGLPLPSSIRVNALVREDTLTVTEVIDEYPVWYRVRFNFHATMSFGGTEGP